MIGAASLSNLDTDRRGLFSHLREMARAFAWALDVQRAIEREEARGETMDGDAIARIASAASRARDL